jgi:hypothetical protein
MIFGGNFPVGSNRVCRRFACKSLTKNGRMKEKKNKKEKKEKNEPLLYLLL